MESQRVAQRIDRRMHLGALAPFSSVVTGRAPDSAWTESWAIQNHRRRLCFASGTLAQQQPQIFDHRLKASGPHPTLHLPINHVPGRQIVRHKASLIACAHDVPDPIEYFTQRILQLLGIFSTQRQIGGQGQYQNPAVLSQGD